MANLRLPKKVNVGGVAYKIVYPYDFVDDRSLLGLCEWLEDTILLSGNMAGKPIDKQTVIHTFIHELLHAIDFVYFGGEFVTEESDNYLIDTLAMGLLQVFRDNAIDLNSVTMPEYIRIGGFDFKIIYPYDFLTEGTLISTKVVNPSIKIAGGAIGIELTASVVKRQLLGGIIRAIGYVYGISPKLYNEITTPQMAAGVFQVFTGIDMEGLIDKWINS